MKIYNGEEESDQFTQKHAINFYQCYQLSNSRFYHLQQHCPILLKSTCHRVVDEARKDESTPLRQQREPGPVNTASLGALEMTSESVHIKIRITALRHLMSSFSPAVHFIGEEPEMRWLTKESANQRQRAECVKHN